jgi:hypothetical protein
MNAIPVKNARKIIDWAGGFSSILTLQKEGTKYDLLNDANAYSK